MLYSSIDGARHQFGDAKAFSQTYDGMWVCRLIFPERPQTSIPPVGDFVRQMSCFFITSLVLESLSASRHHTRRRLCILLWTTSCRPRTWSSPRPKAPETVAFDPRRICIHTLQPRRIERQDETCLSFFIIPSLSMSLGGEYLEATLILIHDSTMFSGVVSVCRNSPLTTPVRGRGHCPGVCLAAGCQRREGVSGALSRECFQVSSAQVSSAPARLHRLSMEREQGGRPRGGPSMMDGTAESGGGSRCPTWVSSEGMLFQVCLCSLPIVLSHIVVH